MPRGKTKDIEEKVTWKVRIPISVAGEIELLLMDPVKVKARYGYRSKLVTKLLRDFIESQRK